MALGKSLCNNCRLRTLYLSGNLIRETGARAIARALAQNRTLTVLHLTGNSIGPEGAHALAEGIVVNKTLTKVRVWGGNMLRRRDPGESLDTMCLWTYIHTWAA